MRSGWSGPAPSPAGRQQGTPLVHDGVMFMPNPNDVIQAIDAVTGDLLWEHRREVPDDIADHIFGLSENNRNLAIHGTFIIDTSVDDHVFALDAATGMLAWETEVVDYRVNPAMQTSGPIVARGKVISGRSCMPKAGPEACVITAHDAGTGEELWRTRLIPAPGEPGDETWGGVPFEERRHVGAWMVPSYDPALNLIYVGTSVTSPAPKFLLGGADNQHLYHNSTLALDADTGAIRWYYQHLNDHWDLDHPFERLLVDTPVAPDPAAVSWINPRIEPGEVRQVVTGIPGKTGVVYTLDRATGEFLWATPTITQNVIAGIDGATGAVTESAELVFSAEGQEVLACPHASGGKDWEAGAYSPRTNTMYYPLRNVCARMLATTEGGGAVEVYALVWRGQIAPGTDQVGSVYAISAETGATAWQYDQRAATMSLVATGGGLVFGGDVNGRFRAFDDETGEILWGDQPRLVGVGVPDHVRRRRAAVRRGEHRHAALSRPDAGVAAEHQQQPVRVRVAVTTNADGHERQQMANGVGGRRTARPRQDTLRRAIRSRAPSQDQETHVDGGRDLVSRADRDPQDVGPREGSPLGPTECLGLLQGH